jgi:hypothetical protein
MKIIVVFDFPEIVNLDGKKADDAVEDITRETVALAKDYNCQVSVHDVVE